MNVDFSLWQIGVVIICVLVSMVVHEFMHAYAGYKLGDTTAKDEGRLTLNPLEHIDPIMTLLLPVVTIVFFGTPILAAKPVPFTPGRVRHNEFGAAMIAAAGPVSNLVLAFISSLMLGFVPETSSMAEILAIFTAINVGLFVFNMLPIPPLDGSRVLYAFSGRSLRDLLERVEPFGFVIIIALVLLGGFGGALGVLNDIVRSLLP
jgi:Zn-dependent protease